jgi:alpha-glucosidase
MYARWISTLDPDRFALDKVQYVVNTLKKSGRDFIVMVDPAVFSGTPNSSVDNYETYQSGVEQDIFMKLDNGDLYQGVVWPGPTVFPDWTAPNAQSWWTSEFARFFGNETGFDVSGIWLDMNEPANFLPYVSRLFVERSDRCSLKPTSTARPTSDSCLLEGTCPESSLGS